MPTFLRHSALLGVAILSLAAPAQKSPRTKTSSYPATFQGIVKAHVFPSPSLETAATLWSKWSDGMGSFRMAVYVDTVPGMVADDRLSYLQKLLSCTLIAHLTGNDRFPIDSVPIDMMQIMDSTGTLSSLEGTARVKMKQTDYENFNIGGTWTLAWHCPGQ